MTDLTELRRLAEAATPWPAFHAPRDRTCGEEEQFFTICDDEAREVPIVHVLAGDAEEPDDVDVKRGMAIAAYIAAADPQTVLGLLDTLDRYRAAMEFYATAATYEDRAFEDFTPEGFPRQRYGEPPVMLDTGKIARAALEAK